MDTNLNGLYFCLFQCFLGGLGAGGPVTRDGRVSWRSRPAADLFALEVRHRNWTCVYFYVILARNSVQIPTRGGQVVGQGGGGYMVGLARLA